MEKSYVQSGDSGAWSGNMLETINTFHSVLNRHYSLYSIVVADQTTESVDNSGYSSFMINPLSVQREIFMESLGVSCKLFLSSL